MDEKSGHGYYRGGRSIFWPMIMIGLGVIWLLANFEIIPPVNWWTLLNLWPLALVALGLQIMFGSGRPWLGNLLSFFLVLGVIGVLILAPSLGWTPGGQLITEQFSEPLDGAEGAIVRLDMDYGDTSLGALSDSNDLIDVKITHGGTVSFSAVGGDRRTVSLDLDARNGQFLFINPAAIGETVSEIGLSPDVPIDLEIDHGSGQGEYALEELQLTDLEIDMSSGDVAADLPAGDYAVSVDVSSGAVDFAGAAGSDLDVTMDVSSGRLDFSFAEQTNAKVEVDLSSGSVNIELPEGVGVRIAGSASSGSIRVPKGYVRVSGEDDDGVWESPDYGTADYTIEITFDVSSGSFNVR
ncbi:MAG: DUF4097 family beta strand repeat protein [Anaerolineales bacterium]|nr:DUF4097 family beta strand repeat protein [Anaerolineales bacterium]